jgi:hypothetical protein
MAKNVILQVRGRPKIRQGECFACLIILISIQIVNILNETGNAIGNMRDFGIGRNITSIWINLHGVW